MFCEVVLSQAGVHIIAFRRVCRVLNRVPIRSPHSLHQATTRHPGLWGVWDSGARTGRRYERGVPPRARPQKGRRNRRQDYSISGLFGGEMVAI